MDRPGAQSRTGIRKREPLTDGTSRANVNSSSPRSSKSVRSRRSPSTATSSSIPHHESVAANGGLTIHNATSPTSSPSKKSRTSAIIEEDEEDKRESQVSTASSQTSNWNNKKKRIGPWLLGRDIGRGMVGKVRKVKHVHTGQIAAAKIIPKKAAEELRAESLMNLEMTTAKQNDGGIVLPLGIEREVVIMKLLEHPNVVKLFDVWENRSELYLIMELVEGGELFEYVTNHEYLEEDETVFIFRQIVAALLNAHRLGIYHRDLKPENILIDIEEDPETGRINPQVKLADFGMAALQPKGKMLSTACGSIHYAAPEVFEKQYDGSKADVWSLGIILYVMLTGMLPFTDIGGAEKNVYWYRQIKSGKYTVPEGLSPEAQDLISRMLVPNPRRRISLESVWNHALFERWSLEWGETDDDRNIVNWIGVTPSIRTWSLKSERDIDKEIFRNLRVLWHSEKEEVLKKRLLSNERNFEKLFYDSLLRHREEQLENFMGAADDLSVHASDHHHIHASVGVIDLPPLPPQAYVRSRSNLSIQHDEGSDNSRSGTNKSSERSYDPYRSSKNPIVSDKEGFTVTVHPRTSSHTRKSSAGTGSTTKPNSLRVDTLKKESKRLSTTSSSARLSSRHLTPSPLPLAGRSYSRGSIVTSVYPSSPPGSIIVRPSNSHRRGVDFSHLRRSSTTSALTKSPPRSVGTAKTQSSGTPSPPDKGKGRATELAPGDWNGDLHSSSPPPPKFVNDLIIAAEKARVRKSKTHSQVIDCEARKVSTELEKFCEEAFNRESNGSSYATTYNTTNTQAASAYDTPPSSVSNRGSGPSQGVTTPERGSWQRPELVSRETPNSYMARELADTRRKLVERYANDKNAASNPTYREVLASIDNLLVMQSRTTRTESRRVVSAPEPTSGALPMITEEERSTQHEDIANAPSAVRKPPTSAYSRSATDPRPPAIIAPQQTIRPVNIGPPSPHVPPLNIRKATPAAPTLGSQRSDRPQHLAAFTGNNEQRFYNRFDPPSNHSVRRLPQVPPANSLPPISEDASQAVASRHAGNMSGRRHGWFGGWKPREGSLRERPSRIDLSRRPSRSDSAESQLRSYGPQTPPTACPGPKAAVAGKRPGFLSLFTRKKVPKLATHRMAIDHESNHSQTALSTAISNAPSNASSTSSRRRGFYHHMQGTRSRIAAYGNSEEDRDLGIQRNWLARFFNIKPASQVMCFCQGRGRVRQELVRLLRSWKAAGVRDVVFDREKNLVFARVIENNYLRIKEVSFVVQLLVVLENGRYANLCIARFVQRKGAASGFRVAVAKIEQTMQRKGFIVMDPIRRREMEEMLGVFAS